MDKEWMQFSATVGATIAGLLQIISVVVTIIEGELSVMALGVICFATFAWWILITLIIMTIVPVMIYLFFDIVDG